MSQLARDNAIGRSTGYDDVHEGIDVLAARAPGLHGALLAAKAAGYSHVSIDGMLVETDRCRTAGPTPGVDLWWSGKHDNRGGNVQVVTVPDGWPIWTSDVRPGREHDTTAVRTHSQILPTLLQAAGDLRTLGDLGYEGESDTITVAFKKPKLLHGRARNLILKGSLGGPISGPNNMHSCMFPSLSVQPPLQDGWSGLSDTVTQELLVAPTQPQAMYPPVSPFGLRSSMPLFLRP